MRRVWYCGVTVLLLVFIVAIYYGVKAQQPERREPGPAVHVGPGFEQMRLNLTEAQKEQIHTIVTQSKKDMIRKTADIRIAGIELRELIADKKVSDETIREKQAQVQKLKQEAGQTTLNTLLQVRQVLTDEQWAKASKMRLFMSRRMMFRHIQGRPGIGEGRQMIMPHWRGSENPEGPAGETPLFSEWENILSGDNLFSDNFDNTVPHPELELGMEPELPLFDLME